MCRLDNGAQHLLPAWMLDAPRCAQHSAGVPMVSLQALQELRRVLDQLKQSFVCDGQGNALLQEDALGTKADLSTTALSASRNRGPDPSLGSPPAGAPASDSGGTNSTAGLTC